MGIIRILFLADTHLGFDSPAHPRVERRRRGADFFSNYEKALEPALRGEVDCVVHGGDLLYRCKVSASLVLQAFEPLKKVATAGIPVYIVPGNHERSAIPYRMFASWPNIFIFDEPQTFVLSTSSGRLGLVGFPFVRGNIRDQLSEVISSTKWDQVKADRFLLCMHQAVEGAVVGAHNYTFRGSEDVIRGKDISGNFTAVLSGHIHRHQVLTHDLNARKLPAPVFYPGSIERTSFEERKEAKGYLVLELDMQKSSSEHLINWRFHELYTRPMFRLDIDQKGKNENELFQMILHQIKMLPLDSVVKVFLSSFDQPPVSEFITIGKLRDALPKTMNIELQLKSTII